MKARLRELEVTVCRQFGTKIKVLIDDGREDALNFYWWFGLFNAMLKVLNP